jgi:hypothetical protein
MVAEVAAAVGAGIAMWPAFRYLCKVTGRRAAVGAVVVWLVLGLLILVFGPRALPAGGGFPLWLLFQRVAAAHMVVGVFLSTSFAGILLVQARLSALGRETLTTAAKRAGQIVLELLWLRKTLKQFLASFGLVISGAVLAAGALRVALLADGGSPARFPVTAILTYGGFFTALTALIFIPAYLAWQDQVGRLRDQLYPVPEDGLSPHDWYESRSDFDTLMSARTSAGTILNSAFGIVAPLAGSFLSTLIPALLRRSATPRKIGASAQADPAGM